MSVPLGIGAFVLARLRDRRPHSPSNHSRQGVPTVNKRIRVAAMLAALFALMVVAAPASAEPTWAPQAQAPIHPGVMTHTDGAQCTSNFVFFDAANNVYIGQAAHCSGTGAATDTNGCTATTLPLGTPVDVEGFTGTMVYNSWIRMQQAGETDPDTCQ